MSESEELGAGLLMFRNHSEGRIRGSEQPGNLEEGMKKTEVVETQSGHQLV